MRRRPSKTSSTIGFVIGGLLLLGAGRAMRAQETNRPEGAADFLIPIGARSIGMGQAVAAAAVGSDALWWNPALIARGPREAALLLSKPPLIDTDASGAVVYPIRDVGTVALSIRYINYGQQQTTDTTGVTGTLVPTSLIYGLTFAAPFGPRLAAGITAKLLDVLLPCTGGCPDEPASTQTSAIDLGVQYILTGDSTVVLGAAVRNVGFKLQVEDAPQADALPARADVGVLYSPRWSSLPPGLHVRAAADIVTTLVPGTPGYRVGAEISWLERYQGRVGYVQNGPNGSGPTFGVGFSTGKLQVDFAQMISDLSAQAGPAATYLTLRYLF